MAQEVPGSIPAWGEKYFGVRTRFPYSVICRDDTSSVRRPSDRDVNWMSHVQGKSSLMQVKEPYGKSHVGFHPATQSVQIADNALSRGRRVVR